MTKIPSVADGLLQGSAAGGAAGLAVGSPAWFAWLADDAARSFSFRSPSGVYTARKERRQRGGAYWVAYRTAASRKHKIYLGKTEDLTPERLDEAAAALAGRVADAAGPVGGTPPAPGGGPGRAGQGAAGYPLLATKLFVPRPRADLVAEFPRSGAGTTSWRRTAPRGPGQEPSSCTTASDPAPPRHSSSQRSGQQDLLAGPRTERPLHHPASRPR